MDTARLITRLTLGSLFAGHGAQKLFGWFGGAGPEGTSDAFEGLGLRPGRRHALGAGIAETAGGALLALGLLTPVAAATLTGVMTTAIRKVHAKNGVWVTDGGFEYNAVVIAALATLVETGPGASSVDASLFPRMKGTRLALASVLAGAAGSLLNEQLLVERAPAAATQAPAPAAPPAEPNGSPPAEPNGSPRAEPSGSPRAEPDGSPRAEPSGSPPGRLEPAAVRGA
jgi:putative oxidoreductase